MMPDSPLVSEWSISPRDRPPSSAIWFDGVSDLTLWSTKIPWRIFKIWGMIELTSEDCWKRRLFGAPASSVHTNTLFRPRFSQVMQARVSPLVNIIFGCVHSSCEDREVGSGRGGFARCSDTNVGSLLSWGRARSPTLLSPLTEGVVMPVDGSEDDSNGEAELVEFVDAETSDTTTEGEGEENMLMPEILHSESRLGRR